MSIGKLRLVKLSWLAILLLLATSCREGISIGQSKNLVDAIPSNVNFIVKVNNLKQLDSTIIKLPYHSILANYTWLSRLGANHQALEHVLYQSGKVDTTISIPMVASLHLAKANRLNSIHYYPVNISKKAFKTILAEKFPETSQQAWNYEGVTFTEVLIPEMETKVTLALTEGILIASPVSFLVEDAVKHLKSGKSLLDDASFKKVFNKEAQKADLNIWFPFENMKRWVSTFTNEEGANMLSASKNFAAWSLLDFYFNKDQVFVSGITSTEGNDELKSYSEKNKCSHSIERLVPLNSASYAHYSNPPDSIKNILRAHGLGNCWTKILLEPLNDKIQDHFVAVFELKDKDLFKTYIYGNEDVKGQLANHLFNSKEGFIKVLENHFAISPSKSSLDNYVNSISNKQVLSSDEAYQKLSEDLKSDGNVTLYVRSIYTTEAFRKIYDKQTSFSQDFDALKAFNQIAVQFSKQGDIYQTNGWITFNEADGGSHTNLAWRTNLDAPIIAGPSVVEVNEDGEKAVLVQDADFNLHLIGKSGQVIWTKKLEGKWLGEAYPLKLYSDGAVQLTLNTEFAWYLLNADGEDFAGFPLNFKHQATTGMAVGKVNGKQSVFIPQDNGGLYGYDIAGKPLSGWNPKDKVGEMKLPAKIIESGNATYIAAQSNNGLITIWNEKGKREAKSNFSSDFYSNFFIDHKASPFKLKNVKENGELISLNKQGKAGKFKLATSKVTQFDMVNITGNSDPEIILSSGSTLRAFSYTGSLLWKANVRGQFKPVKGDDNQFLLAVHDDRKNKLVIIDGKGKVKVENDFFVGEHFTFSNLLGQQQSSLVSSGEENDVICYRFSLEQ